MPKPTECRYCGCDKFNADSVTMTRFRCGSSYWPQAKMWQLSNECAHKCAVQSAEMREQIKQLTAEKLALNEKLDKMWEEAHSRLSFDPGKKSTEG